MNKFKVGDVVRCAVDAEASQGILSADEVYTIERTDEYGTVFVKGIGWNPGWFELAEEKGVK